MSVNARRFTFVVFSDSGHLNPMIAVAQHLEREGHDTFFYSVQADVAPRLAQAGLRARSAFREVAQSNVAPEPQRSVKLAKRLTNPSWAKWYIRSALLDLVPVQVAAVRPLLAESRPDIVVADPMVYAGPIAAELEGIPWVSIATGLQSALRGKNSVYGALAAAREQILAPLGVTLRFDESDAISPLLNTVFAAEDLVPSALRGSATYVGPAIPLASRGDAAPFPFDRLPTDRPLVYIAFGSAVSHGVEVYEAIVKSLGADEAFFVITAKDLLDEPFFRDLPAHALAVSFAPQLAVLERATVMVNHGGANSVNECLYRGKPMVVVPVIDEHILLGECVSGAGVGTMRAPQTTTEGWREVLRPLLAADAPEAVRARAIAERAGNGAARVAKALVELELK